MSEPEKLTELGITLGSTPEIQPLLPADPLPPPESLQFRKAEHPGEVGSGPPCALCSKRIADTYYHANGKVICPGCATTLQTGETAPPAHTLLKSFVYGLGAAIAGTALFSFVWIVSKSQWALIAILIGYMVARAVRHASNGLGGRPQQILAALLTYFSVSFSIVPVMIYHAIEESTRVTAPFVIGVTMIGFVTPFLGLKTGLGGILGLLITFFGIQRAWRMTGRTNILVMGPYQSGS